MAPDQTVAIVLGGVLLFVVIVGSAVRRGLPAGVAEREPQTELSYGRLDASRRLVAIPVQTLNSVYPPPMASAELSRRVEKVVGYPPLSEMGDLQRREFHEALLEAASFEDLPGKWQAAILEAEQNRDR